MIHATFACPDLTTFCRLDELGLETIGQRLEPDRAVLACRVVEPDEWCRRCGCRVRHGTRWCAGWRMSRWRDAGAPRDSAGVSQFVDVLMLNRYYGWYVQTGDLRGRGVGLGG